MNLMLPDMQGVDLIHLHARRSNGSAHPCTYIQPTT